MLFTKANHFVFWKKNCKCRKPEMLNFLSCKVDKFIRSIYSIFSLFIFKVILIGLVRHCKTFVGRHHGNTQWNSIFGWCKTSSKSRFEFVFEIVFLSKINYWILLRTHNNCLYLYLSRFQSQNPFCFLLSISESYCFFLVIECNLDVLE